MKLLILAALVCSGMTCAVIQAAQAPSIAGDWMGKLDARGVELRLLLHLKQTETGWTGSMDSLDQGAKGMPIAKVLTENNRLTLQLPAIGGSYEGVIAAGGKSITGTWTQGGGSLPLVFNRTDKPVVLNRPQEPQPPFPYRSQDVAYPNPEASGLTLAGTFTYPKGAGPFPAVLLITGSGAQNRDEEIFGHKPFLVWADYLTRRGIAVLRVDDRGVGKTTGSMSGATTADFATDVTAGVHYLLGRSEVDKRHVGLIGHSEGGVIAPMVASQMPEVAFIVLLAGTGVPGDQVIAEQSYRLNLLAGQSPEQARKALELEKKLLAVVREENDAALREKNLMALANGDAALEKTLKTQLPAMNSPWFRYFLALDPAPVLAKVKCPVLALVGSKDSQVDAEQNVPTILAALKQGGNHDATVETVPGVNHLFQTAKTGAVTEYGSIEETVSPKVLELVSTWIERHTSR